METTSNRLDFVQVSYSVCLHFIIQFAEPQAFHAIMHVPLSGNLILHFSFGSSPREFNCKLKKVLLTCVQPCGAEKGGHGDEEGWHQGADYVDCVPGCSVHNSFRVGVLDIAKFQACSVSRKCICFAVCCGTLKHIKCSLYELPILCLHSICVDCWY